MINYSIYIYVIIYIFIYILCLVTLSMTIDLLIDLNSDCRDYGPSCGPWFPAWLYPPLGIPMSRKFEGFEVRLPQWTFRYLAECRILRKGANAVSSATWAVKVTFKDSFLNRTSHCIHNEIPELCWVQERFIFVSCHVHSFYIIIDKHVISTAWNSFMKSGFELSYEENVDPVGGPDTEFRSLNRRVIPC
jgi:hypothetical protein